MSKFIKNEKKFINLLMVATGHHPHRPGMGKHGDRRLKRLKTRSAQRRQALSE